MFFSVIRRYRSDVGYWLTVSIDSTDVTLVSEDTYGDDGDDEDNAIYIVIKVILW